MDNGIIKLKLGRGKKVVVITKLRNKINRKERKEEKRKEERKGRFRVVVA